MDFYSAKNQSSLARFLLSHTWDHELINQHRISFARGFGQQTYKKYYSLLIDDGVTKKYGKQLPGGGYYYSHKDGKTIWEQPVLTSHLHIGGLEMPLLADIYLKSNQITTTTPHFRSKLAIVAEHITKFPKIAGLEGMGIADSWFSSQELLMQTITSGFTCLFAIKVKVAEKNKFVKVKDFHDLYLFSTLKI